MISQICISRLDKMGDMILSLPVIKAIKIANPDIQIYVLASYQNAKVLRGLTYIDKIILIDENSKLSNFFKNIFKIRKLNVDLFLNFSPTLLSYILCFFSNARDKATLIYLSRYKKSIFSKILKKIISRVFCRYVYTIDRYTKLQTNENIHQTNMMFELVNMCHISFNKETTIDICLPKTKLNFSPLNKELITIHLSNKWINNFFTEKNFLDLIIQLPKKKYVYVLTTDNSSKDKFKKVYDDYKIFNNNEFSTVNILEDKITILDKLNYENWLKVIYSSTQVITPECGCSHIASACKIPVTIIYDANNLPEAIYNEYHPWKSKYNKLFFNDIDLSKKIINILA